MKAWIFALCFVVCAGCSIYCYSSYYFIPFVVFLSGAAISAFLWERHLRISNESYDFHQGELLEDLNDMVGAL